MPLLDRIGIAIGIKRSVEDGLRWAAPHGLRYVDFRLDTGPEAFGAFTSEHCAALRTQAEAAGITMGLHTLSAVNMAEYAPYLAEAADQYVRASIDIAKALHAGWVDVHAGDHCASDVAQRKVAGLERLQRAVGYAETQGVLLLLENLKGPAQVWGVNRIEVVLALGHSMGEIMDFRVCGLPVNDLVGKIHPSGGDVEGFRDTAPSVIQEATKGAHGPSVPQGGAEERIPLPRGEIEASAKGIIKIGRVRHTATRYKCAVAIARQGTLRCLRAS
jgi:hypothetical protein